MSSNSNKGKNEKVRENLVIFIFTFYTVFIAAISTFMQWKSWIAPLMLTGMIVCCLFYMIKFRSYYFRAMVTSVVSWINISLFVLNSGNFLENTALLAAVVILTSVYTIPDVLHINLISYTVHDSLSMIHQSLPTILSLAYHLHFILSSILLFFFIKPNRTTMNSEFTILSYNDQNRYNKNRGSYDC